MFGHYLDVQQDINLEITLGAVKFTKYDYRIIAFVSRYLSYHEVLYRCTPNVDPEFTLNTYLDGMILKQLWVNFDEILGCISGISH